MKNNDEEKKNISASQLQQVRRSAFVGLQAGCLTFFVAGTAIIVGWLLDSRMDTFPRWTLILLIGTAPLTLAGVYLMVRRAIKGKARVSKGEDEGRPPEDG